MKELKEKLSLLEQKYLSAYSILKTKIDIYTLNGGYNSISELSFSGGDLDLRIIHEYWGLDCEVGIKFYSVSDDDLINSIDEISQRWLEEILLDRENTLKRVFKEKEELLRKQKEREELLENMKCIKDEKEFERLKKLLNK